MERDEQYPHAGPLHQPIKGGGHALLKWVTSFPGNPARGLPTVMGVVLLSDASNGAPVAVLDAASVTALRTGATDWNWHSHSWGVVFEVCFDDEAAWDRYRATLAVQIATPFFMWRLMLRLPGWRTFRAAIRRSGFRPP